MTFESDGLTDPALPKSENILPLMPNSAALLDKHHHPEETKAWFEQRDLEQQWAGEDSRGEDAWLAHIEFARKLLAGEVRLGKQPDDLAEVMTLFALGGPAICAMRALDRFPGPTLSGSVVARNAAGKIGWAHQAAE